MASTEIWVLPSVPFLKPTGMLSPLAIWRWVWLSVVRAPMAAHVTRSARYWGTMGSRNSVGGVDTHLGDLQQQLSALLEAAGDVEGVVHLRIVQEALPADGGARLLEVDPHDDEQPVGVLPAQIVQPPGIFECGALIVDRARSRDHEESRVLTIQDRLDRASTFDDRSLGGGGRRQILDEVRRRYQLLRLQHVHVPCLRRLRL